MALAIALAAFCLAAGGADAEPVTLDRVVAVVEGDVVTWVEMYEAMRVEYAEQLKGMSLDEQTEALKSSESEYLQTLVIKKLQMQHAASKGYAATDDEVDSAIMSIREKYEMGPEAFKQAITKEGLTWEQYRQNMREQITIRRVIEREIAPSVKAMMTEDEDTKVYVLRFVLFAEREGESTDERVERFLQEMAGGESFESLEPRYTDGPSGELSIEDSQLSMEFRLALDGLAPGQTSKPFSTARGVGVLKLYDVSSTNEMAFTRLLDEQFMRWLRELVDNSYIDIRL